MTFCLSLFSCNKGKESVISTKQLQLISISVGSEELDLSNENSDFPLDQPLVFRFSQALNRSSVSDNIFISDPEGSSVLCAVSYLDNDKTVSFIPETELMESTRYDIVVNKGLEGLNGEVFSGLTTAFTTMNPPLEVIMAEIEGIDADETFRIKDIDFRPVFTIEFSPAVDKDILKDFTTLKLGSLNYEFSVSSFGDTVFIFTTLDDLPDYRKFRFSVSEELGAAVNREFEGLEIEFYTKLDSTYKFPELSDSELLTLIQEKTFSYFYDFAHPVSGLTRERNTSYETVTTGGSGFGIMALVVGMERSFISREEGVQQLEKIIAFLEEADRFHGVWPHWLNGSTGEVIPFSSNDDGGDIVETSYLIMGLLTMRQYLNDSDYGESLLIDRINSLVGGVEWDWYRQNGQNVLYWHWSPNYGWEKNMKVTGYNEALITYVIAAASENHGIPAEVYHQGWARNGDLINGDYFYDILLPLGNQDYGGPLFFEQYTFLGIDPRNLSDTYANYWQQAKNHTLINREYCIKNPKNYISYSEDCWGLTASDGNQGYSAHSPTNDRGVITPTAAISSLPFTPEESMKAIRHFYYLLGDKIWGEYGFYDAFNVTENWYASSYLAIDQGPILIMIENYRSNLLWDLFMSCNEIQDALNLLGFTY